MSGRTWTFGGLVQGVQTTCYLFGRIAGKCKLLKDEDDEPLNEIVEHEA